MGHAAVEFCRELFGGFVVEFFDGLMEPMRAAAMTWLEDSSSRGHDDAVLWSRLIETPFDDVRLQACRLPATPDDSARCTM
jgi:hypothetical protein